MTLGARAGLIHLGLMPGRSLLSRRRFAWFCSRKGCVEIALQLRHLSPQPVARSIDNCSYPPVIPLLETLDGVAFSGPWNF